MAMDAYQDEEWRVVTGYEGLYEVSSHGRIVSLARVSLRGHHLQRKMLKPSWDGEYFRVTLSQRDGKQRQFRLHVLVATAFIGPLSPSQDIDHVDQDRSNNTVWNLRYLNKAEHTRRHWREGSMSPPPIRYGEKNHFAKLSDAQVAELRRLRTEGFKVKDLAIMFAITRPHASRLISGYRRKNLWPEA